MALGYDGYDNDGSVLVQDALGRVRMPLEKRKQILDENERSGMSGAAFAALVSMTLTV
jgi:hypothetical protein